MYFPHLSLTYFNTSSTEIHYCFILYQYFIIWYYLTLFCTGYIHSHYRNASGFRGVFTEKLFVRRGKRHHQTVSVVDILLIQMHFYALLVIMYIVENLLFYFLFEALCLLLLYCTFIALRGSSYCLF